MLFFGALGLLMSSLRSYWRLLAQSDPKITPKTKLKLDQQLGKNGPKNAQMCDPMVSNFWTTFRVHFGVTSRHRRPIKPLQNVKMSSKSAFSPQQFPNSSQHTHKKRLTNVKLSFKSASMTSEHPKPSPHVIMAWSRTCNKTA